jgi:Uma2 family endonuclease
MVQTPTQLILLEEFLDSPETDPASEYVDGQVHQKPMPQGKHSKLQTSLASQINKWGEAKQLAYAFTELRCTTGGRSIVPDIAVFLWANLPLDENGEILDQVMQAPDWAVEILSPEQAVTRPMDNLLFLLQQGMSLGWLVDPYERVVFAFQGNCAPVTLRSTDPLLLLEELSQNSLTANELFDFLSFSNRLNTA